MRNKLGAIELWRESERFVARSRHFSSLWLLSLSFILVGNVQALTCQDIDLIDRAEGGGGALALWSGCEPISGEVLARKWDSFPEIVKIVFSAKYIVPGRGFPDLSPGSRADQLIGSNNNLLNIWALSELQTAFSFHALWLDKFYEYERLYSAPRDPAEFLSTSLAASTDSDYGLKHTQLAYMIKQFGYAQLFQLSADGVEQELVSSAGPVEPAEEIARESSLPIADWYLAFLSAKRSFAKGDIPEHLLSSRPSIATDHPLSVAHVLLLISQLEQMGAFSASAIDINGLSDDIVSRGHILSIWAASAHVDSHEQFMLTLRGYGFPPAFLWMVSEWLTLDATESRKKKITAELEAAVAAGAYEAMPVLADFYKHNGQQKAAAELELRLILWDVTLPDKSYNAYESLASTINDQSSSMWGGDQKRIFLEDLYQHCLQTQDDAASYCSNLRPDSFQAPIVMRSAESLQIALETAFDSEADVHIGLSPGRYAAVLIGNNEYSHWDDLRSPMNDIQMIGGILESKYDFHVKYVRNESRRNVLRAIYETASELTFDDHLMIYYAGHGVVDPITENAYWIPSEASRDFRPDWISADEILDALKVVPTRHILLVADSCYSGKLLRSGLPAELAPNELVIERLFSKRARVALTSGGDEPVVDSTGNQKNSVFALALGEALSDARSPTPASTIYKKTFNKVASELSQTPQYDGIRELGHDGGDFVFIPADSD